MDEHNGDANGGPASSEHEEEYGDDREGSESSGGGKPPLDEAIDSWWDAPDELTAAEMERLVSPGQLFYRADAGVYFRVVQMVTSPGGHTDVATIDWNEQETVYAHLDESSPRSALNQPVAAFN